MIATLDDIDEVMEEELEQDAHTEEAQPEPPSHKVGKLSLSGKDTSITLRVDAVGIHDLAHHYRPIMILSAAGSQSATKALHAVLAKGTTGNNVTLRFDIDGFPIYDAIKWSEGYKVFRHRMAYNTWHCLFVAKTDSLLLTSSDEALWQVLRGEKFTTPILRSWMPYIRSAFLANQALKPLKTFQCEGAMLYANDNSLDAAVSTGLKERKITIE